jgi:hypothetical protein
VVFRRGFGPVERHGWAARLGPRPRGRMRSSADVAAARRDHGEPQVLQELNQCAEVGTPGQGRETARYLTRTVILIQGVPNYCDWGYIKWSRQLNDLSTKEQNSTPSGGV